jgi:hypothetical protein
MYHEKSNILDTRSLDTIVVYIESTKIHKTQQRAHLDAMFACTRIYIYSRCSKYKLWRIFYNNQSSTQELCCII